MVLVEMAERADMAGAAVGCLPLSVRFETLRAFLRRSTVEIMAIVVVGTVLVAGAALTVSQTRAVGHWMRERWQNRASRHLMRLVRNGKAGI